MQCELTIDFDFIAEEKPTKILKDVEESANIIDDEEEQDFYGHRFRPSIDRDVLNSVIVEENDEDIQSLSSSVNAVLDQQAASKESAPNTEISVGVLKPEENSSDLMKLRQGKVDDDVNNAQETKLFSVTSRVMTSSTENVGKETDVDDDEDETDHENKDLYHSKLVTTCVDSEEDEYDLKVPNESWLEYKSSHDRPQPVGCSSDSPSASTSSIDGGPDNAHYDSLEDCRPDDVAPEAGILSKKRSLPPIPVDHNLQQIRAYEILRQKIQDNDNDVRQIEGQCDHQKFKDYHNQVLKRQLPKPPAVSPLVFHDSGVSSLEAEQSKNENNFLWVGLEGDESSNRHLLRPKNHDRLASKKRHSAPPGSLDHFKLGQQSQSRKKSGPSSSLSTKKSSGKKIIVGGRHWDSHLFYQRNATFNARHILYISLWPNFQQH